jgi:4-carboxymuconolactone decarboxylase
MTHGVHAGPPRIPPLPPDQWDERLTKLLEASPGGTAEPMHIFTTLARNPELNRRWLGFGGALLYGTLSRRLIELVILRTAYRFDGPYEWAQHVEIGLASGLTHDEITAVGGDLDSLPWDAVERAALDAVDETHAAGAVSDPTWATLAGAFSESELLELLMLIGHYLMLTYVLRSVRIELEPRARAIAETIDAGPALD